MSAMIQPMVDRVAISECAPMRVPITELVSHKVEHADVVLVILETIALSSVAKTIVLEEECAQIILRVFAMPLKVRVMRANGAGLVKIVASGVVRKIVLDMVSATARQANVDALQVGGGKIAVPQNVLTQFARSMAFV